MNNGKGGNNGGPWGRKPNSPPSGGGGGKGDDNITILLKKGQDRFRGFKPEGQDNSRLFTLGAVAALGLWLASGFYVVDPEEQGVVLRFGKYERTVEPGLRYHIPAPFETVYTPQVTRVQRIEIGYRGYEGRTQPVLDESLMLTGDENIIDISFNVQWKIKNAKDFLFNVRDPEQTIKDVSESVMREVISQRPLIDALTEGKQAIQDDAKTLLQKTLDHYKAGILIDRVSLLRADPPGPVIDSFRDVQAAKADQERKVNEARAYANEILPRARGEAEKLKQDAEAYRSEITNRAEGDASRFLAIYNEYKQSPEVTRKRLYLETVESVMQETNKMILDDKNNKTVPYLPLPEMNSQPRKVNP